MKTSKIYMATISVCIYLGIAVFCSACQGISVVKTPTPTILPPTSTLTIAQQQPVIWSAWTSGPHGSGYDLGKGPNTYCARCHSPTNWDPSAKIDPPPNCVSCKFPHEDTVRIAEGNPLIPEEEWTGINCTTCHIAEKEVPIPGISWFDNATGYNETVTTSTELCEKCHRDTQDLRYKVVQDDSSHPGYTCTSCHDPHTTYASCGSFGCHGDIVSVITTYSPFHVDVSDNQTCLVCHPKGMRLHSMEVMQKGIDDCLGCHENLTLPPENLAIATDGHAIYHKDIQCVVCHDASGLVVKPIDGQDQWMTFRTTVIESLGRPVEAPFTSHNLQRQVTCERCHYSGNPWEVSETVIRAHP
jgi:hypothetical protein